MDEELKRCSNCETFSSKSNFLRILLKKMVIDFLAKFVVKSIITKIKILNNNKNFNKKNRSKINAYEKQKRKTDFNFTLLCNMRRRTSLAFKSQNIRNLIKQLTQ